LPVDIWTGTFRYENSGKDFFAKSYPIPLEASDLPAALRAADTWIHKRFSATNKSLIYQMRRSAPFRKDNMTDAQKKALSRYKIETPNDLTKGQAMDLLTKLKFGQLNIWRTQFKLDAKQKQLQKKKSERALLSRHNQQQPTEIY
jgi:ATP-dependent helicase IRC3